MHNIRNRNNPNPRLRLDPTLVWEDRKTPVMREAEAERAASNANTARLRALRLEKEAADRLAAADAPPPPARKRRMAGKA
jgi:hypothetical protein